VHGGRRNRHSVCGAHHDSRGDRGCRCRQAPRCRAHGTVTGLPMFDTGSAQPGSLSVALHGAWVDGHDFALRPVAAGAVAGPDRTPARPAGDRGGQAAGRVRPPRRCDRAAAALPCGALRDQVGRQDHNQGLGRSGPVASWFDDRAALAPANSECACGRTSRGSSRARGTWSWRWAPGTPGTSELTSLARPRPAWC